MGSTDSRMGVYFVCLYSLQWAPLNLSYIPLFNRHGFRLKSVVLLIMKVHTVSILKQGEFGTAHCGPNFPMVEKSTAFHYIE